VVLGKTAGARAFRGGGVDDADAFFASVEQRQKPSTASSPVVVCGLCRTASSATHCATCGTAPTSLRTTSPSCAARNGGATCGEDGAGLLLDDPRIAVLISDDHSMTAFQCVQVEVDVMGGEVGQLGGPDDEDSVGTSRNTYVLGVRRDVKLELAPDGAAYLACSLVEPADVLRFQCHQLLIALL
jgi:hypothetical protein